MSRTQELVCPPEVRDILVAALLAFIESGFPVDGTECSLVAREALADMARALADENATPGIYHINRRQRALLKSALGRYYTLQGSSRENELGLLLALCEGQALTREALDAARCRDAGTTPPCGGS